MVKCFNQWLSGGRNPDKIDRPGVNLRRWPFALRANKKGQCDGVAPHCPLLLLAFSAGWPTGGKTRSVKSVRRHGNADLQITVRRRRPRHVPVQNPCTHNISAAAP